MRFTEIDIFLSILLGLVFGMALGYYVPWDGKQSATSAEVKTITLNFTDGSTGKLFRVRDRDCISVDGKGVTCL